MSHKTTEEYAKIILEDDAIVESFIHWDTMQDMEKIVANIIDKYNFAKVLR